MKNYVCLGLIVASPSLYAMQAPEPTDTKQPVLNLPLEMLDFSLPYLLDESNPTDLHNLAGTCKVFRDLLYARSGGGIGTIENFVHLCSSLELRDSLLHQAAAKRPSMWKQVYNPDRSDLVSRDRAGSFPMHYAAACGNLQVIIDTLNENCDINGDKRLYAALYHDDEEELKKLLENNVSPLGASNLFGETPLGLAKIQDHQAVIALLQKSRAELLSPAHLAVQRGNIGALRLLAEHGASMNIHDYQGRTLKEIAKKQEMRDVIDELLLAENMNNLAL